MNSIFSVLTVIFVIAKLAGWITWSWLWVLAPLWIGLGITAGFLFVVFMATAAGTARSTRRGR